jgi:mannitol-1-phosphate/altronate dehydrogenase
LKKNFIQTYHSFYYPTILHCALSPEAPKERAMVLARMLSAREVSDAELDAIIARNNLSHTGSFTREDVRCAFASLNLPAVYADSVFAKVNSSWRKHHVYCC